MALERSPADARSAIVAAFYSAVQTQDTAALTATVDQHFATNAVFEWPQSLPYGGRVEGSGRLRAMFAAMAGAKVKIGPDAVDVVSLTAGGDYVAAELSFNWYPPNGSAAIPSAAVELWRFEGDQVVSVKAFYWDTAALVAAKN